MSQSIDKKNDYSDVIKAIEAPVLKIYGITAHLRIVNIYPSSASKNEITLQLEFRLGEDSKLDIVQKDSVQAHLLNIGFSYRFDLNKSIKNEVRKLTDTVKRDANEALERIINGDTLIATPVSTSLENHLTVPGKYWRSPVRAYSVLVFSAGFLAVVWFSVVNTENSTDLLQNIGASLLLAGGVFFSATLIGFLFGIPRQASLDGMNTFQREDSEYKQSASSSVPPQYESNRVYRYQTNTNLEQISDWLTKILVVVTLINLPELPNAIYGISENFGRAFIKTEGENIQRAIIFTQITLIYFGGFGLMFGYLSTRLYLVKTFAAEVLHKNNAGSKDYLENQKLLSSNIVDQQYSDTSETAKKIKVLQQKFDEEFLQTYNGTKKVRRLLRAKARTYKDFMQPFINIAAYDEQMQKLIDLQLQFEYLEERVRTHAKLFEGLEGFSEIQRNIIIIEKYLDNILDEYEEKFPYNYESEIVSIERFPRLTYFIAPFQEESEFDNGFKKPARRIKDVLWDSSVIKRP
jgi:hypothetical protein